MSAIQSSAPRTGRAAQRHDGRLLVRREVAPHERKRDRRLLARDEHVERLDSERAALAVRAFDDPNGVPDAIAVAEREHGDRRVGGRARSRPPALAAASRRTRPSDVRAASARAACAAASSNTPSRSSGGTTPRAVRRVQRVERREHDHAVGVAECGLDHGEAVLGRRVRLPHGRAPGASPPRRG